MDVNRKTATRKRSFSQRLSSSLEPLTRPIRPTHSRVASESFVSSASSGMYKGQVIGAPPQKRKDLRNRTYLNPDDINQRAIQILHSEDDEDDTSRTRISQWFLRIIHPYDQFRRMFDVTTVIWVLLLVFFIPLEIGFDWFKTPKPQKILFGFLDFWFAIDIILNFRTGYVNHGTVVMDSKKIAS